MECYNNKTDFRSGTPGDSPVPALAECLKAATDTRELILKNDALADIPDLLSRYYDPGALCLIADENTDEAAGKKVMEVLLEGGIRMVPPILFPGNPRLHADYRHIGTITGHIRVLRDFRHILPVAIGGGTINDLVKRAASELELPYLCVPTAASVDGYTSYGAALLAEGYKQTFPCSAPRVVAADTEILQKAPAYLSSSGFGDLAGKLIAGTDWIIAERAGSLGAPGTEPIDSLAWSMTQTGLQETLRRSVDAVRGDGDGINTLFTALSLTGFAMQHLRSSRPVSGCEHLWSHVWEMEDLSVGGVPVTHGHKVAMGTLAATAFTELVFASAEPPRPAPCWRRPSPAERETEVRLAFGYIPLTENGSGESPLQRAVIKTALEKLTDQGAAEKLAEGLRDTWKTLREAVLERLLPYKKLVELFRPGGCPLSPGVINLSRTDVIAAARRAQMIRNRYTVLDLAWDLGIFETVLAKLEESPLYLRQEQP
ncbi:MAG: sn-glycerol-1-phosphate dehydrogenase [Spirochaetaceae bacterium]|jgi:glycerol-1-phosphate dehydrogenase [NAD(P)+]|nr:sn-glycerol-1-phosphate dehydrogenase [Spirochaetaceae bacterium]